MDTYGFRLMVIQAVLQGQRTVTRGIVEEIVDLLKYEVAVRKLVQPVIADNALAEMEQTILRYLPPSGEAISRRELYRKTHADRKGPKIFGQALGDLWNDQQIVRLEVETGKGKPSVRYALVVDDDNDGVTKTEVTAQALVNVELASDKMTLSPVPAYPPTEVVGIQPGV